MTAAILVEQRAELIVDDSGDVEAAIELERLL